ncbi:MAG: DNA primase [Candidatus Omnitrophica bacterium]|nr:DNA primase [Candidatus Omnitrophota bacterium]
MAHDHSVVDKVQSLNDIVEIISSYIPLKRAGRSFKALCPFHKEKTPSFIVNPDKQIFHCFGCNAGGDVFTFLMKHENMTFPEALRNLAERVNFKLPEQSSRSKEEVSKQQGLLAIYEKAYEYYRSVYEDSQKGARARQYVKDRGFSEDTAKAFGLGYALDAWRGLFEFLAKKDFPQSSILSSGLIQRSSDGNPYDLFRGRLIFPIWNSQGKVIAFGGRILTSELPKYVNSPESELFKKRSELYGLNLAKRHIPDTRRQLLVVEGYFDLIRLHEAGFKNSVATLGTALTEDHARLIHRYADEAVLVFDPDAAGEAASLRGLDIFLEEGLNVKLLTLPAGFDPDDFIWKKSREAFLERLEGAEDLFDFKLRVLNKRYPKDDSLGLVKVTTEIMDTLGHVKSQILLDRYIQKLSEAMRISEPSIRLELNKMRAKHRIKGENQTLSNRVAADPKFPADNIEATIIALLLSNTALIGQASAEIEPLQFRHPLSRTVLETLIDIYNEQGQSFTLPQVLNRLPDEATKAFLSRITFFEVNDAECEKAFRDCLTAFTKRALKERMDKVQGAIREAERNGEETGMLVREYQNLLLQAK